MNERGVQVFLVLVVELSIIRLGSTIADGNWCTLSANSLCLSKVSAAIIIIALSYSVGLAYQYDARKLLAGHDHVGERVRPFFFFTRVEGSGLPVLLQPIDLSTEHFCSLAHSPPTVYSSPAPGQYPPLPSRLSG